MDNLLNKLEVLKIRSNFCEDDSWALCIDLIQKSFAPQRTVGMERPCEEKDFREYRLVVERNLHSVRSMLQHILNTCRENNLQLNNITGMTFGMNLLLLIGEHSEKNIWNTAECVSISKELLTDFCDLYACQSISRFLMEQENLSNLLLMLRPKLLKDTWKTYPSAVACYRWILQEAEKPGLFNNIGDILPTALIILDDYFPDNVVIGLECIYQIIQHSYMKKGLIDTGYAKVIYHALERLTHQKEVRYIMPLYSCMASLLATTEHWDNTINLFEWTTRDDVLLTLIDNMEFEQNIELRHAYMLSLPQLITNIGCAKWCEALTRVLTEYCEHYTDLRTLKATLEMAKTFLLMFRLRVAAHCTPLYTAFLKLHFDLSETPVFDRAIIQNLEDCICMLHQLSPNVACAMKNDNRMRSVFNGSLPLVIQDGDIKYFE
ncbi:TELO2-interacting protein 2 [Linepithema humile]|uniref:TELO2-interacting protein 2 n=1 Tax=Linepithema humile TaxID=83485 RepID=UPI000623332B|nr:PREDICTED: TELO2-interacting protein 2-like [Linepithema humile]XP_012221591.1 PREDICTED: TELO2-interacting protein 2-like [Linepithema humile]